MGTCAMGSEGQLGGLHGTAERRHGNHFPPVVTQLGHVLLGFPRQLGPLEQHRPRVKVKHLGREGHGAEEESP